MGDPAQPAATCVGALTNNDKNLAVSFIQFIRHKVSANQCTDDQIEALEVAAKSLESAFALTDEDFANQTLLALFTSADRLPRLATSFPLAVASPSSPPFASTAPSRGPESVVDRRPQSLIRQVPDRPCTVSTAAQPVQKTARPPPLPLRAAPRFRPSARKTDSSNETRRGGGLMASGYAPNQGMGGEKKDENGEMKQEEEEGSKKCLDSLSGPPLDRLFFYLRTDGNCTDLANLSMVSPYLRKEVIKFMRRPSNRPGLGLVLVEKANVGLWLSIEFHNSNAPFHDLSGLGGRRRVCGMSLRLRGPEDPVIPKVADLLSTTIRSVLIGRQGKLGAARFAILSSGDLSLIAQLLRNSTIGSLDMPNLPIDETTAPLIPSLISRAKLVVLEDCKLLVSDPEAFIAQLDSVGNDEVSIFVTHTSPPLLGLPNSFWETFINNKLRSGSVQARSERSEWWISKAPLVLRDRRDRRVTWVEWRKVKTK